MMAQGFSAKNPPEEMLIGTLHGGMQPLKKISITGTAEQIGLIYKLACSVRDGTLIADMGHLLKFSGAAKDVSE